MISEKSFLNQVQLNWNECMIIDIKFPRIAVSNVHDPMFEWLKKMNERMGIIITLNSNPAK